MLNSRYSAMILGVVIFVISGFSRAEDWPTFGHDARRSQVSLESVDFTKLARLWDWQSPQAPLPAWGQPAKGDAFASLRDLASMRNYDPVFHPIAVGDAVYFGSNADDSVRCLDAVSGEQRWQFIAGGPVRIAPTFDAGRIYFGADDGYVYCLSAENGKLLWRFSPSRAEPAGQVINNGRLVSFWPCRTGVAVVGETAYFGCSLLPWKPSFLCAVDARTGAPRGEGRYVKRLNGYTLDGPVVTGGELLYAPQGREAPLQFQLADGKQLGALRGAYGAFCLLTPENRLLHGPSKKGGGIVDSSTTTRTPVASHKNARAMIVTREMSLMLTTSVLAAADLKTRKISWTVPVNDVAAMAIAGDHILLGRRDRIDALAKDSGKRVWSAAVEGRAFGLAVARGRIYASTDTGQLTCFSAGTTTGEAVPGPVVEAKPDSQTTPKPIEPFSDDKLLGRWVFSPLALEKESKRTIRNLSEGLPAKVAGEVRLTQFAGLDGVVLDGATNALVVSKDIGKARLPRSEMTAEAWVRIDRPTEWGGIVGAIQDNGSYERGWLLGFRNSKFSLSLVGKDSPAKLTYLNAKEDFQVRQWHHVAGTYDGQTMRLYVDGEPAATSTVSRGEILYPPRAFYEIGAYHDDNEYYRTQGMIHEVRVYDRALSGDEIAEHFSAKPVGPHEDSQLAIEPWIRFDTANSAIVRWRTDKPTTSKLILEGADAAPRIVVDDRATTEHALRVTDLGRDRRYTFVIQQESNETPGSTRRFELDTYFNFQLSSKDESVAKSANSGDHTAAAKQILAQYPRKRGLCVVVGSETGELAIELARLSELHVIGLATDDDQITESRSKAMALKLYGSRCSFVKVESLNELPLPTNVANLLVSQTAMTGQLSTPGAELQRLAQPQHGMVVLLRKNEDAAENWPQSAVDRLRGGQMTTLPVIANDEFSVVAARRGALPGAADWTHMYGDASNSAYAGESLSGVKGADQMKVAWMGRPGPRYQTDRQNRKSAPLFAGGRLYMQGQERIIALDGYNGSVIWSLELPGLLRFNIPRDASNWCCDSKYLYVAHGDQCWQIDGETGAVMRKHQMPAKDTSELKRQWGYLATVGDTLLGGAVRKDSMYVDFWGGQYWFDQKSGPLTNQVCSESLFARNKQSENASWRYSEGLIWNATITAAEDRVFFIESRGVELPDGKATRLSAAELDREQFLVALDLKTGTRLWQQPVKISPKVVLANMAYSDGKVVLVTSVDKQFPVRVFSAGDGKPLWQASVPWPRSDHGGHLSRPAIVGDRLYVRPATLSLSTGKLLAKNMPGGGCGTYVCTKDALFFRAGSGRQLSTWDPQSGRYTQWARLRPDCWLSTIPAGGMLLSPEGGGGCSCGHWLEMSVGFVPRDSK